MRDKRNRLRLMQAGAGICDPTGVVGCFPAVLILAAIMFPVFAQARDRAREVSSVSNLKIIGLAVAEYNVDFSKYPRTDTLYHFKADLLPYTGATSRNGLDLFSEPGVDLPYALNMSISTVGVTKIINPQTTRVAWEVRPHADGKIAVLYADGHVALVNTGDITSGH